ncbi:MAG TPA: ferredoxin [Synergistaceae bacterium]|nr:ferredoxin [Synergistaceae bacterium]
MGIKINLDECIGCGVCSQLCPEIFKLDEDEGKSMVISQKITDCAKEASDSCPVSAITID